jgi:hypothetical protein
MKKGYIAIASVLVISAFLVAVVISLAILSVSEMQMSLSPVKSEDALRLAESCAEDTLLRVNKNPAYTVSSLSIPLGTCTITMSSVGANYTLAVDATKDGYNKKIQVLATRASSGISITSWKEI